MSSINTSLFLSPENAPTIGTENWFTTSSAASIKLGSFKREQIKRKIYKTHADARQAIFYYIEMIYNPKRRHTSNDRVSPNNFESNYFNAIESV